jgi:hypothetical protein
VICAAAAHRAQAQSGAAEPIDVSVDPVPLNPRAPGPGGTLGALEYLAGYELSSSYGGWGGFSGLAISADGDRLLAVSDVGLWLDARAVHEGGRKLADVNSAFMVPLLDEAGQPLHGKVFSDAEALATDLDGSLLVSFEREHRLWRYTEANGLDRAAAVAVASPLDGSLLTSNAGAEGLAVLTDGTIVVLTEGTSATGSSEAAGEEPDAEAAAGAAAGPIPGWIRLDGTWHDIAWQRSGLFRVTDAAGLPNGDLLVLERRFTRVGGPAARLTIVPRGQIEPGAVLVGQELALLRLPQTVDNFEGVAARRGADGSTLIYILSDDNRHPLQRTLLLQFRLRG